MSRSDDQKRRREERSVDDVGGECPGGVRVPPWCRIRRLSTPLRLGRLPLTDDDVEVYVDVDV